MCNNLYTFKHINTLHNLIQFSLKLAVDSVRIPVCTCLATMASPNNQDSAVLSEEPSVLLDKDLLGWRFPFPQCVRVLDTGEPVPTNPPSVTEAISTDEPVLPTCQTWPDSNASDGAIHASSSDLEKKRTHWNLRKIFTRLNTQAQCIQFAEEHQLVPQKKMCNYHKKEMTLNKHPGKGPFGVFRCNKSKCRRKKAVSRAVGTWFENVRVPLTTAFEIMYMYSHNFSYLNVQREIAREDVATIISQATIADWFSSCRETITVYHLDHQDADRKIGGPGKIVHIDQSKFGELKYKKTRNIEGQWVIGMMEVGNDDLRLELCPDNEESAKMLIPMIIQKHVEEGTEIHTNFWNAFDSLPQHGYIHAKLNQSNINGSKSSDCTESQWRKFKPVFKRDKYKGNFSEWLVEYSWRRNIRMSNKDAFEELLKAVAYVY